MEGVTITFNASGKRFDITRSCLKNGPERLKSLFQPSVCCSAEKGNQTKLTMILGKGQSVEKSSMESNVDHFNTRDNFSTMVYDVSSKGRPEEYFIARNPDAFGSVVDYCMTGELHMPPSICAGVFHREMDYWGLDCHRLEPCCHGRYDDYQEENRILKAIYRSEERSVTVPNPKLSDDHSKLNTFRKDLVALLEDPTISRSAKIYFWIGMAFVFISLFVLCAGSHKLFQVALNENQWKDYLGDEFHRYSHHFHHHSRIQFPDDNVDSTIEGPDENEATHRRLNHTKPPHGHHPTSPGIKTVDDDQLPLNTRVLHPSLRILDNISVGFFTVDLIIRFLLSYRKRRFFCSFLNVIDLVCLLPYYIIWIIETLCPRERYTVSHFDFLYALTVVRVFRIFRLSKESLGLRVFILSCEAGVRGVALLLMFLGIGCLIFACLVYFAEAHTEGNDFTSIPTSLWWALVTMTTVGYGDIIPKSALGKLIGSFAVVSGVLVVAITVPVLSNSFNVYYRQSLKLRRKNLGKAKDGFVRGVHTIKVQPSPPIIENAKY